MNPTNRVVFRRVSYKTEIEMWENINSQIKLLLDAGYLALVQPWTGEENAIVVDFVPSDIQKGDPFPYFLYPDEATIVAGYREELKKRMLNPKFGLPKDDSDNNSGSGNGGFEA